MSLMMLSTAIGPTSIAQMARSHYIRDIWGKKIRFFTKILRGLTIHEVDLYTSISSTCSGKRCF